MSFAVVVGAVIGLGATVYSTMEQKKMNQELQDQADADALEAQTAQRLAVTNSRTSKANEAKSVKFGSGQAGDEIGSYGDFYSKNDKKPKKTTTPSLGFGTSSSGVQV